MGRTTQGMTAIKLSEKDFVKSACIISNENDKIFFVTKKGLGKTTLVTDMVEKKDCNSSKMVTINDGFPRLKRSSNIKGRIGITLKNDALVGIYTIHGDEVNDLIITTHTKVLTISTKEFLEPLKRSTQGKRLIQIKDENDYIVSVGLK
jgi:DNA gyrase/topoisomerase IV subunit A